eukprot:COSAG01_NODE_7664_length_3109_cov_1.665337_5_plen_149_part_00
MAVEAAGSRQTAACSSSQPAAASSGRREPPRRSVAMIRANGSSKRPGPEDRLLQGPSATTLVTNLHDGSTTGITHEQGLGGSSGGGTSSTSSTTTGSKRRLECLDVVRGLNVLLMIFVDNVGGWLLTPRFSWVDHAAYGPSTVLSLCR